MKSLSIVFALFLAAPLAAEGVTCGSTMETDRQARELARFVAARPHVRTLSQHSTRIVNDFIVVPADEVTAPFDDPADLEGASILFTRKGPATFAARHEDLVYDSNVGVLFESFGRGATTKELALTGFEFPFGDAQYPSLTLSVSRGIHFTDRPALPARNFAAFEMLTSTTPLISPLFDFVGSPSGRPDVYVKQSAEAVTITWRSQGASFVRYDMQAVLFHDGSIRFAYRILENVAWGGVVLTTGRLDAVARYELFSTADPEGDVPPAAGAARGILDVKRLTVSRFGSTSLLEVKVEVASEIVKETLNGELFTFTLEDSINRVDIYLHPDRIIHRVPRVGDLEDVAVSYSGSTITFFVDESLLALTSRKPKAWLMTGSLVNGDTVEVTVDLGAEPRNAETDLSELTVRETAAPFIEAFSVPTVNVHGVWDRLQKERGYSDDEIDAVFVYTPFLSDLIFKPYGAYALFANAGADGVAGHASKDAPRTPTLVNMNRLGVFGNYDTQVLMHEFAHRWLYYFDIFEEGAKSRSLNPLGAHPAQFVHTPAAFPASASSESSVMGGAAFTEIGTGMFRSPLSGDWWSGFAWHELYLMGLARVEEVEPWWYIRGSFPALGLEYYPPANLTVTGARVNVTVEQIIEAMGPRNPGFDSSQKDFRVLFVMLERPGQPVGAQQLDPQYRLRFESAFNKATGGRGRVRTTALEQSSRRRAARP